MRRKIRKLKKLFLTISRSFGINFLLFLVLFIGIIFNLFGLTFYKIMLIFVCLELLFVDANNIR